jgi:hypothetical protein
LRAVHEHDLPPRAAIRPSIDAFLVDDVEGRRPTRLLAIDGTVLATGKLAPRDYCHRLMETEDERGVGLIDHTGRVILEPRPDVTGMYGGKGEMTLIHRDGSRSIVDLLTGRPVDTTTLAPAVTGVDVVLRRVYRSGNLHVLVPDGEDYVVLDNALTCEPLGIPPWCASRLKSEDATDAKAEPDLDDFFVVPSKRGASVSYYLLVNLRERAAVEGHFTAIRAVGARAIYLRTPDNRHGYLKPDGTWLWEPRK